MLSQSNPVTHLSPGYYSTGHVTVTDEKNGSLGGQLQPLTLFRNILTLDENKILTLS